MRTRFSLLVCFFAAVFLAAVPHSFAQSANGLQPDDYQRLRSAGQAELSPDAQLLAYSITRYDRPGRPWGQLWVMDLASGKSTRLGAENEA
jgi:hypothetical protein